MGRAFVSGLAAAVVAGVVMFLFRLTMDTSTVPEVLLDWVTSVVPLGLFSSTVQVLGDWAKRLTVIALIVILLTAGGGGGVFLSWLQKRWSGLSSNAKWWIGVGFGMSLWLSAMVLVLPISGWGFFGLSFSPWPMSLVLVWLSSSLTYSLLLIAFSGRPKGQPQIVEKGVDTTRRLLVKRLAYALAGLVVAFGAGFGIFKLISSLFRRTIFLGTADKLPPEITPNEDFFTVSSNVSDPGVRVTEWKLEVDGLVEHKLALSYEQLKELPATSEYLTLECISNRVGGEQIANAQWKGVKIRELLSRAGVDKSVRKVILHAADSYTDSITLEKAMEQGTLIAYEMNGVPIPAKHGFPARLLVPNIYGMKNVKWLTKIELVDFDYKGYWQRRGWSDEAIIKTMSRIDVPKFPYSHISSDLFVEADVKLYLRFDDAGDGHLLGGVSFAGNREISRVEVSTDDGQTWSEAEVKEALSPYTWVLWVYNWKPPSEGNYTLLVRATDGEGTLQSEERASPLPDGASGYHRIAVRLLEEQP